MSLRNYSQRRGAVASWMIAAVAAWVFLGALHPLAHVAPAGNHGQQCAGACVPLPPEHSSQPPRSAEQCHVCCALSALQITPTLTAPAPEAAPVARFLPLPLPDRAAPSLPQPPARSPPAVAQAV